MLASKHESLLVWGNALLVLNLGLNILNGIAWLNLKGDAPVGQSLDKFFHFHFHSNGMDN